MKVDTRRNFILEARRMKFKSDLVRTHMDLVEAY